MGSTGTGNFSDYPKSKKAGTPKSQGGGGGTGDGGAGKQCDQPIDTELEEVERCAYFKANQTLPAVGTKVVVEVKTRVAALVGGLVVGYFPTKYNYLRLCIETGYTYVGKVTFSASKPIGRVKVHVDAVKP